MGIDEAERSLHDSIMIVRRAMRNTKVVGGGGAIEMELSRYLREYARTISGKQQLVINYFARALEVIPMCLASNSGADGAKILNELRQKHAQASPATRWYGVDCIRCTTTDCFDYIWEPMVVKEAALAAACEAACLILSIDETVKNPQSEKPDAAAAKGMGKGKGKGMGKGRGRGMRAFRR